MNLIEVNICTFVSVTARISTNIFYLNYFEKWSLMAVWIFWRFMDVMEDSQ